MANYRPIECPRCLMHVGDKGCVLHRAAPELLEALESLLNVEGPAMSGMIDRAVWHDLNVPYHFDKARAAIAQAKGQR